MSDKLHFASKMGKIYERRLEQPTPNVSLGEVILDKLREDGNHVYAVCVIIMKHVVAIANYGLIACEILRCNNGTCQNNESFFVIPSMPIAEAKFANSISEFFLSHYASLITIGSRPVDVAFLC